MPARMLLQTQTRPSVSTLSGEGDQRLGAVSLLACALFLVALVAYNFVDIDLWHQMALIRESLSVGHLLKTDIYAYTPTIHPWIDHEWGAGAIAYFGARWLGSRAIIFLKYGTALGTALGCFFCARSRGTNVRVFTLCAPLSFFLLYLGFFSTIRAQAYSFLFTSILLWLLKLDKGGSRLWIIPWLLAFPLWVNLHAGFAVAIVLVGLHAVEQALRGEPWRHLLWLLFVMPVDVLINPYGTDYFGYLRRALFMARPYSPEWNSILTLGNLWIALFGLAIAVAAYAVFSAGWRQTSGLLVLVGTAFAGALHRKMLPFFAIAWLCYVPSYLQLTKAGKWWLDFSERRHGFLLIAWAAFAAVCVFAALRQKPWEVVVPQPLYPVGPVKYLEEHQFAGNLMVPFRLGAYVSWKLYPAVKVSLDSRYEVAYPDPVVRAVFDFYAARPSWRSTLLDTPTDAVLVPIDAKVRAELAETNWHRVYSDREFVLYARPGLSLPVEDWSRDSFQGVFP